MIRTPTKMNEFVNPRDTSSLKDFGKNIVIRGARVHNLKNISLELPRNKLIVFTGVSGSGKSSLAFDTIYAEGQRRFVESLSVYARQFLERMDKPDVDFIRGISPAIAIEQKTNVRNPRSTVGTATEVYDYLRLLFARVGKTYCRNCGQLVQCDSVRTVLDKLRTECDGQKINKIYVLFPVREHQKATIDEEIDNLKKQGFYRILYKDEIIDLNEKSIDSKAKKREIFILVDRLIYDSTTDQERLIDSIETSFTAGEGDAVIKFVDEDKELHFNQYFQCTNCKIRYTEPDPRLFSFNNPFGACPKCQGFGRSVGIDIDLVVPNKDLSIRQGAIHPWSSPKWQKYLRDLMMIADEAQLRLDVPFKNLSKKEVDIVLNGYRRASGIYGYFKYIERKSYKVQYRVLLSRYRGYTECDECDGSRLRKEASYIKVGGKTISEIVKMTIDELNDFIGNFSVSEAEMKISHRLREELTKRLRYLVDVGIGYLTINRLSNTLSGGETQRINLATALGSSLIGSLYILDEPSVGLHPRDNHKLISILKSLRDIGNTVIVVEHDTDMIKSADLIVDIGPGAGTLGGTIVFQGGVEKLINASDSITGRYISGKKIIPVPEKRRIRTDRTLKVRGAAEHNLKSIDVEIPLHMFVVVTGVSGSGKSTLVHDILFNAINKNKGRYVEKLGLHKTISGIGLIDDAELVDQSPIGKTSRSNPVTYIKAFDLIRGLFAKTQTAKIHGYKPGYFSFNVPGGRCEACQGCGFQTIEMQFLADIEVSCEICGGSRFKKEILNVLYQNKNINDVLNMTVAEALEFFDSNAAGKPIAKRLRILDDVGLGYIRLGQSATTLSGGEAQRVKLASHLANQRVDRNILFIFDEPTTGLHFDDIAKLLRCFDALIERGNSVLIIEHNMDVIKCADWIIDIGPDAGDKGGEIIASGTPEEVSKNQASYTAKYLRKYLI